MSIWRGVRSKWLFLVFVFVWSAELLVFFIVRNVVHKTPVDPQP